MGYYCQGSVSLGSEPVEFFACMNTYRSCTLNHHVIFCGKVRSTGLETAETEHSVNCLLMYGRVLGKEPMAWEGPHHRLVIILETALPSRSLQ